MHTVWAQRREEVLSDCLVSPDVFHQAAKRLPGGDFPPFSNWESTLRHEKLLASMHFHLSNTVYSWHKLIGSQCLRLSQLCVRIPIIGADLSEPSPNLPSTSGK